MSQDIIADALNEIMNAKRAKKEFVILDRHSKLLINILDIAKEHGYIKEYKIDEKKIKIDLGTFMKCNAIKPRFNVKFESIDKYMKRYLPARDLGILIISTNKGLMTQEEIYDKEIGGVLIAYFY